MFRYGLKCSRCGKETFNPKHDKDLNILCEDCAKGEDYAEEFRKNLLDSIKKVLSEKETDGKMRFTYDEIMKMTEGYLHFDLDDVEEVVAHLAQIIVTMVSNFPLCGDELIDIVENEIQESEEENA